MKKKWIAVLLVSALAAAAAAGCGQSGESQGADSQGAQGTSAQGQQSAEGHGVLNVPGIGAAADGEGSFRPAGFLFEYGKQRGDKLIILRHVQRRCAGERFQRKSHGLKDGDHS